MYQDPKRFKAGPLPSEKGTTKKKSLNNGSSQGHNQFLTVVCVPNSLDSGELRRVAVGNV